MDTLFAHVLRWLQADSSRLTLSASQIADALGDSLQGTRPSIMRNARAAREALDLLGSPPPATACSMVLAEDAPGAETTGIEQVDRGAPDTTDSFALDWDAHEYVFDFREMRWTVPFGEVAAWCWWYPTQGERLTASQLTLRAGEDHGRDLSEDWARRALRVLGVRKGSPPFAPHELMRFTPEQLAKIAHQRRANAAERALRRDEARQWRSIAQDAQRKLYDHERRVDRLVDALASRRSPERAPLEVEPTRTAAVVALYDAHIGKRDVDGLGLEHTVEVMVDAVRRLAARLASTHGPERIIVAVGGDYLHVDTMGATSTAGTPQDVDATTPEILAAGIDALIESVDELARVAPVEVVIIPGNHDRGLAYAVMQAVARHYAPREQIAVRVHEGTRAYVRYGASLVGLEHGDGPKVGDLAAIMATERASDWGESSARLWLVGHLHHVHEREVGGVHVVQVPSLAGADAWHNRKGYVTSTRALRAYLLDYTEGMVGHVQVVA